MLLLLDHEQEYIGSLFEVESQEDSIWLHFDVFIGNRDVVSRFDAENILEHQTGLFRIEFNHEQFSDFFNITISKASTLLNNWFELKGSTIESPDSAEALYYAFDFRETDQTQSIFFSKGDIGFIRRRKKEDKEFLNKLRSLVDLKDLYDKKKTETALNDFSNTIRSIRDINEINIVSFNVGQGNATGIFDKELNPILYYDLGGGAYWNKHTYPNLKTFPLNKDTFIILSHWDFDHYESIKANPDHYKGCTIIAPLQETTPSIRKFAASIASNLFLIDKDLGRGKNYSFIKLFKCSGQSRNDSGLGILLDLKKDDNISEILLPGDSQYSYIKLRKEVDAICVSHHGGKLYNTRSFPTPKERGNGYCVYSYGKDNTYSHPKPDTIQEHINRGWGIDRFLKKYSLSTTTHNVIYSSDRNISSVFNTSRLNTLGTFNSFHGIAFNRDLRIGTVLSSVDND
jgi:beta-lactamase superfamily II metal-dependent hydrolase